MRQRTAQTWDTTKYYFQDWSTFVHAERDDATIRVGKNLVPDPTTIVDLSAGGGKIATEIGKYFGVEPFLSDLSYKYGYAMHGPMEHVIEHIPDWDLWINTETVEHLEDPDTILRRGRDKAARMLLTTPTQEVVERQAEGHLWVWDREGVEEMLRATGWKPVSFEQVSLFGIWVCE